jgi:hypothetical protein
MVRRKQSKWKSDPSRAFVGDGDDSPVAGRGGPGVLPESADTGSWQHGAVGDVLRRGNPNCNTAGRDHNAGKSRTPHGIPCGGKYAGGETPRQECPCPLPEGAGQRNPIMARLEPTRKTVVTC